MKSLSLGKLFGIKMELHWTFLIIAILAIGSLAITQPQNTLSVVMVFFFLFFSVFLHELVHSVVSIQRGIKVKKIVLLPIGGASMTESLPDKPIDEFLIAVSGPAFNFVVAISILLLVQFFPLPFPRTLLAKFFTLFYSAEQVLPPLLSMPLFTIFWWNLILGAFNLFLPALPLDGGRVFRSLLSFKMGRVKATELVTKISSLIAILMFLVGFIFMHLLLMVIAFFVFFGSREEEKLVLMKEALKNSSLKELVNKKPLTLDGSITVKKALEELLSKKETIALVNLSKEKYAVLSIEDIEPLLDKLESPLKQVLNETKPIPISMPPSKALEKMLTNGKKMLPVTKWGKPIGVIKTIDLKKEVLMTKAQEKLKKHSPL